MSISDLNNGECGAFDHCGCKDKVSKLQAENVKLQAENAKLLTAKKELGQIGTGLYAEVEKLEAENAKLQAEVELQSDSADH